jgi:hypothetical protein
MSKCIHKKNGTQCNRKANIHTSMCWQHERKSTLTGGGLDEDQMVLCGPYEDNKTMCEEDKNCAWNSYVGVCSGKNLYNQQSYLRYTPGYSEQINKVKQSVATRKAHAFALELRKTKLRNDLMLQPTQISHIIAKIQDILSHLNSFSKRIGLASYVSQNAHNILPNLAKLISYLSNLRDVAETMYSKEVIEPIINKVISGEPLPTIDENMIDPLVNKLRIKVKTDIDTNVSTKIRFGAGIAGIPIDWLLTTFVYPPLGLLTRAESITFYQ